MAELDERTAALCASPAGCAFLLVVEENELTPEIAAEPRLAVDIAAIALSQIDIWASDHEAVVASALEHGPRLKRLARSILMQSRAAWWFAPIDRNAQWSILRPGEVMSPEVLVTPPSPPTSWELYAQKPLQAVYSSTVVGDTCSVLAAIEHGAGDFLLDPPIGRVQIRPALSARIFEVNSPQDWHRFASHYPATDQHGQLVPDWGLVAAEWDAIHLTLGGLLTAEQVRVESSAGWTELQKWHAEQTAWMHWVFAATERLPDLTEPPASPASLEPPSSLFLLRDARPERLFLP